MTSDIPGTLIKNLQKVADIYDWFDPAIDHILRNVLRTTPGGGSRRSWEFAMIYLALRQHGVLSSDARGLGLGVGSERLIYGLLEASAHLTVTDLYGMSDGWKGVQTPDPQILIRDRAPWEVDFSRINAHAMDMREITYPDESFDFAWSTGSFEHIGDDADFDRHLAEVYRVLKPGGVYVFTTVILYGSETARIPHNYYFDPHHFADILNRSPFEPLPEFDCSLRQNHLNAPTIERPQNYLLHAGRHVIHPIVGLRRGIIVNANIAILRKTNNKSAVTKVVGAAESGRWLHRKADSFIRALWAQPQIIGVEQRKGALVTQPESFLNMASEFRVDFLKPADGLSIELMSRAIGYPTLPRVEKCVYGGSAIIPFQAVKNRIYMLRVWGDNLPPPGDVIVRARAA